MNLSTLLGLKRTLKSGDPVKPVAAPIAPAPARKPIEQTPRHKQETADCPKHFCIYTLRFGCPLCVQDAFHNTFGTQHEGPMPICQMDEELEKLKEGDTSCPS